MVSVMSLILIVATGASASSHQIIVKCTYGADINRIAAAYGGTVQDYIPGSGTWLLSASFLPSSTPRDVVYAEVNLNVSASFGTGRIVSTKSPADWYRLQPALKLIRADAVNSISGRGVVIADIDSLVDYSHPSLAGHLTGGYDFILGKSSTTTATLNQADASFLDQADASFLDQSSSAFLDQSSASFLNQADAAFLDAGNPAHGHGTLVAGIIAGVAPRAMIMPLRVFDDQGGAYFFTMPRSISWAVQHCAPVISMSF